MNELITVAKYWREWADPRLVILVLHNDDLNQVTWEQRVMEGDPRYDASQDIPDFPYARYAELCGLGGIRVDAPEQVGAAWEAAFAADRPVLIDAITDPEVPPLPPHITLDQAKHFAESVWRGDSRRRGMVKESVRQKVAELLPGG
jgi:pyruvate dehydrogenase (quinone)